MFALHDVTVQRGQVRALDGVSVTVPEQRVALIGNNGSGKSSLVRLLNGLLKADSGRVDVNGTDPARAPREAARKVGFIFQNPDHQIIFPTVEEEVAFGLEEAGASRDEARMAARKALSAHGAADWAARPVHHLSEGQRHLVCLIAILAMEPEILVLDEPYAGLDLPTRRMMAARIAHLSQQVIMITHDLEMISDFDRAIWLANGTVAADGSPPDVIAAYIAATDAAAPC